MKCQNKRASGAASSSKSIAPEETTTRVLAAGQKNNKRSGIVCRGTVASLKIWLRRSMKMETKFYLAYGLAGIWIASMVRTLSESRNKINEQPTKEEEKWQ
jgi:hypothetical protein